MVLFNFDDVINCTMMIECLELSNTRIQCGNAKQWEWDVNGKKLTSCVSVTAWPAPLYKNYVELLKQIDVKTTLMPLSWFLNSKVGTVFFFACHRNDQM